MDVLDKAMRWYLSQVGFNILLERKKYLKRNLFDIATSTVYSTISMICLIKDKASILVLILNGLCMARIILKNTIKSSELTDILREKNNHKLVGKYHYFHKGMVQITFCTFSLIVMIAMSFNMDEVLIKVLTALIIVLIWLDDLESACITMWGAEINPLVNE